MASAQLSLALITADAVLRACEPGGVRVAVQPLVRLEDGTVAGYEALGRVTDDLGSGPAAWLDVAEELGLRTDLELAFLRAAALAGAPPWDVPLFVNVSAVTLLDPRFDGVRAELPQHVLELSEHDRVEDYAALLPRLRAWQAEGTPVAVDDVGAGYANMASVLKLRPAFVKIDRSLVSGLDRDARRRAVVAALHTLARASGAVSVAEGVERPEELAALRDLGIDLAQGYLLARPGAPWPLPGQLDEVPAALDVSDADDAHVLAHRVTAAFARDPQLLPSIYLARGGWLRCIARHGQSLVLDGIEPGTGLTGAAYATGTELLVRDVTADPRYRQAVPGVVSEMAVPLRLGDEVVGVFNIDALRHLTDDDVAEVRRAARLLEERLAVVGAGEQQDSLLLRLGRLVPDVAAAQTVRELAGSAVRAALGLGAFDTVALWSTEGAVIGLVEAQGPDQELLRELLEPDLLALKDLVGSLSSCYSGGHEADLASGPTVKLRAAGVRALVAVPLRDGRRLIGFLIVTRRTGSPAVQADFVQALELLCLQVGSRYAAITRLAELEHTATRDPLTGIANRSPLDLLLDDRVAAQPFSGGWLALFDLDRFKEVNDRWGHAAGDDMLRSVAELINSLPESLAVRLGGDEFALLLRPHRDALDLCEQLRMQMQELLVRSGADVSVGVAAVRAPEEIRLALRRADEALYQRKRNGGAGLTVWTDLAAPAQRHVERELDRRALR